MIRLITSYYPEKNPERKKELLEAILRNAYYTGISETHVLCEGAECEAELYEAIPGACTKVSKRPTFKDFFDYANELITDPSDITIICNTDLYFTDVSKLSALLNPRRCLALSRYDMIKGELVPHHNPDTQDAWIFQGKIRPVRFADFYMGKPGCDNRIAHELQRAGYELRNPVHDVISVHLHETGIRNYTRTKAETVPPPYAMVKPERTSMLPTYPKEIISELEIYPREAPQFKRVLHVGFPMPALNRAFQSVAEAYQFIEWRKSKDVNAEILQAYKRLQPDLVFIQTQTAGIIEHSTLDAMAEAYRVNWTGDVRHPLPDHYIKDAPHYDLTLFSNENDVEFMRSVGLKASYLQIGFEDDIFTPKGRAIGSGDVVFMANHYPNSGFPLTDFRFRTAEFLYRNLGSRFQVWGNGFRFARGAMNGEYQKEAAIYRGCKMALSISHFDYSRYFSDRLLRAMGTGIPVLSHHYTGIEKDFIPGVHLETFTTMQELLQKIQVWRRDPQKAKAIGQAGSDYVHQNCTWETRLQQLQAQISNFPK